MIINTKFNVGDLVRVKYRLYSFVVSEIEIDVGKMDLMIYYKDINPDWPTETYVESDLEHDNK